jgi:hypothetical protein
MEGGAATAGKSDTVTALRALRAEKQEAVDAVVGSATDGAREEGSAEAVDRRSWKDGATTGEGSAKQRAVVLAVEGEADRDRG